MSDGMDGMVSMFPVYTREYKHYSRFSFVLRRSSEIDKDSLDWMYYIAIALLCMYTE